MFQFLSLVLPHYPTFDQVEAGIQLLKAGQGSRSPDYPGGRWLEVKGDHLVCFH